MAGTSEGVRKSWLKRRRAQKRFPKPKKGKGSTKAQPRPETEDTMKKGQTMAEVAKKWKVSIKELIKLNNITSIDQIKEGLKLRIPAILSDEEKGIDSTKKAIDAENKRKETARKKEEKKKK